MRSRILLTVLLTGLFVIASGCGGVNGCPVCGTTKADGSFDISWINQATHLDYVSDRIGLAVVVVDTINNVSVNAIQGVNAVTGAGNQASPCDPSIPPTTDVVGNFTRFGCRNAPFHLISGFGANGKFGGFPGAQCCASRANGVNPMSGPDGEEVTPDGKTLFTAIGNAGVVVFDLSTMNLSTNPPAPPTVLATIPTGTSADYDGPLGIAPCVASWNGEAGSAATCGDDRADEMAYDPVHKVLAVINGDPGLPFVTFIDMSHIVGKTGTLAQQHCLPLDPTLAYGPWAAGFTPADYGVNYPFQGSGTAIPQPSPILDPGVAGTSFNPPSCIIGQIYYDGAGGGASGGVGLSTTVPVDTVGATFPCPDPSNPHVFSGVSGGAANAALGLPGLAGVRPSGATYTIPCHHGPIIDQTTGAFCNQATPGSTCAGAIAPAGLGGEAWNPNTGHLLQANENCIGITNIGCIDEIDPRLGNPNGPVVVNTFVMPNCMPTSLVQGPGNNFLVGCADHDGEAFPPNEYVIDGSAGTILATITNVGGVDEVWYNSGDNRYYVAARDMPNGPVMGVIDAATNVWLQNVVTNANSHSIAVDSSNNHAFVPLQSGGICTSQSSNGCVGVYAQQ
jgi:hypothetical protein